MYVVITLEVRGQGPAPRLDNLRIGAVSRHSLGRLNTSNEFKKNKKDELREEAYQVWSSTG